MNVIVAGQRIVTEAELVEAALGFDVELPKFDSAAGQDALRDIVDVLATEAEDDVDAANVAYYGGKLGARVLTFPHRSGARFERGAA
ncbi:hypothetical protein [Streptomyces sp. NPDC126499]|uniref:hypothetical protein n=1 Tax=Streptomyces sp. NPDC126499 TaxID=3155314 RepID=UPI003321CAC9